MSAYGDKKRAFEITVSAKGDKVRRGLHGVISLQTDSWSPGCSQQDIRRHLQDKLGTVLILSISSMLLIKRCV